MSNDQSTGIRHLVDLAADGKKYRKRRGAWERFWLRLAVLAVLAPLDGVILMSGVTIARRFWLPNLPTIGYWGAVLVAFFITALIGRPSTAAAKS